MISVALLAPGLPLGLPYLMALAAFGLVVAAAFVFLVLCRWPYGYSTALLVATGLAVFGSALSVVFGLHWLYLPTACVILGISLIGIRLSGRGLLEANTNRQSRNKAALLNPVLVAGLLILLLGYLVDWRPLGFSIDYDELAGDIPLFASMIEGLASGAGLEAPFASGLSIRYHWTSYGFASWLHLVSGLEIVEILAVVAPFWFAALLLFGAMSLAHLASKTRLAPTLGVVALAFAGGVGVWQYTEVTAWEWFSPSTLLGGVMGILIAVMFLQHLSRPWNGNLPLFPILGLAVITTKASMGVVTVVALSLFAAIRFAVNRAEVLRALLPALALIAGTFAGFVFFLYGNNNELYVDTTQSDVFTLNLNQGLAAFGIYVSYLSAPLFFWGGLLLAVSSGQIKRPAFQLAVIFGLVGQVAFIVFAAPDSNDRFLSAAGLTIAIPIFGAGLAEFLPRNKKTPALPYLAMLAWAVPSAVALAWAAWQPFFVVRPILYLAMLAGLAVAGAFLVNKSWSAFTTLVTGYGASLGISLMLLSLVFPQFEKIFDSGRVSTDGGFHFGLLTSTSSGNNSTERLVEEVRDMKARISANKSVAIASDSSVSNSVTRWLMYAWGEPVYITPEKDLDRLLMRDDAVIGDGRRQVIQAALQGDAESISRACGAGVQGILLVEQEAQATQSPSNPLGQPGLSVRYIPLSCELPHESA